MNNLAAGCILALIAAIAILPQTSREQSTDTKPAPEDIAPTRVIADPYPAFNGIAVDGANGLVAMSDPNRKSLLLYDRTLGAPTAKRVSRYVPRNDCRNYSRSAA